MRALVAMAIAGVLLVPGTAAVAKPSRPTPDLVTSSVSGVLSGSNLSVSATISNKGKKRAKKSSAAVYLSSDTVQGPGDALLGTLATPRLRPGKKAAVSGTLAVPAAVPPGTYHAVVCADSAGKVKERKEGNNCAAAAGTVAVAPLPSTVTLTVQDYLSRASISVNGSAPSTQPTQTYIVPRGSPVLISVAQASAQDAWAGDWESPDPSKPCDGTSSTASDYKSGSMTFVAMVHDTVCLAKGTQFS